MDENEVLNAVKQAAVEVLGADPEAVTQTARFGDDLDADSLDLVELVMALEERLDVTVPEAELEGIVTVGDAVKLLTGKLAART